MNPLAHMDEEQRRPVLFVGYWELADGLTASSIMPGVRLMLDDFQVPRVILATVERSGAAGPSPIAGMVKALHLPWHELRIGPKVMARTLDHLGRVRQLVRAIREHRVGVVFARTAPAAVAALAAARITRVPLVVESFEPHADYMADCGEWSRRGALYKLVRRQEQRVLDKSRFLITVAHSYRDRLLGQGVDPDRVLVAPCPVDMQQFTIDTVARTRIRTDLALGDTFTGVYAGKFGGLYHDHLAFQTFKHMHDRLNGRFKLIVLTPDPPERVKEGLNKAGFPIEDAWVSRVPHEAVPHYLNAADMAFALYKRTPSSAYLSPVKIGEYWACGLPVLLTRGVADDGGIIEHEGIGGALFDPEGDDLGPAIERILQLAATVDDRVRHRKLAERYRSIGHTRAAYDRVFTALGNMSM